MAFTVNINAGEHQFEVDAGETVLEAALRQDIGLPYGCRNGACGSCVATLQSGQVSYPSGKTGALEGLAETACLTCQAVPLSDLQLEVKLVERVAEIEVKTLPCRVARHQQLAHDVMAVWLKLPDNQRLQFLAGQYLNFLLSDGRERAFSIANAPHDDEFIELHVRHVDGGEFTDYVFERMQDKAILRIKAPLGSFVLREESERPMIFVAGGTGFAPIKGQIEHAIYIGETRLIHLYWGVRSLRDLYMGELVQQWADTHDNIHFVPVLSEPDADWQGRKGFVHEAVVEDFPDMSGFDVYMAGPPVMVNAGRDAFLEHGLTMEHMFSDSFDYADDSK
ncbi:MAG: CDP-6-deoxy-delta-3,4-glucoseen reductase [Chromatiales bacterium]|jgi:CDP-4-dehydro-6-deoxyglucose reductase